MYYLFILQNTFCGQIEADMCIFSRSTNSHYILIRYSAQNGGSPITGCLKQCWAANGWLNKEFSSDTSPI